MPEERRQVTHQDVCIGLSIAALCHDHVVGVHRVAVAAESETGEQHRSPRFALERAARLVGQQRREPQVVDAEGGRQRRPAVGVHKGERQVAGDTQRRDVQEASHRHQLEPLLVAIRGRRQWSRVGEGPFQPLEDHCRAEVVVDVFVMDRPLFPLGEPGPSSRETEREACHRKISLTV